jgi:hypothetical protein
MELSLNILANFLGVIAIILSTWAFIISKRETTYSDLDNGYNEILKMGIEYPKFRNINLTSNYLNNYESEDDRIAYENYAFLTMNFCETIFDRAGKDKKLLITWLPALQKEYFLHSNWIKNPENDKLFKSDFKNFIKKLN